MTTATINLKNGQKLLLTPEMYSVIDSRRKAIGDIPDFFPWRGWDEKGVWFTANVDGKGFNKGWLQIDGFSEQGEALGSGFFPIHIGIGMRLAFLDKAVIVMVGDSPYRYVPGVPVELVDP